MPQHYEEVHVHGYDAFRRALSDREGKKDVFAYFCGDRDVRTGASWCPDCARSEPVVRGQLCHLPEGSVFVCCEVGDRSFWKDPDNVFKKTLKLRAVPTLLRYGAPSTLVEDDCCKPDLVMMMFTQEEGSPACVAG